MALIPLILESVRFDQAKPLSCLFVLAYPYYLYGTGVGASGLDVRQGSKGEPVCSLVFAYDDLPEAGSAPIAQYREVNIVGTVAVVLPLIQVRGVNEPRGLAGKGQVLVRAVEHLPVANASDLSGNRMAHPLTPEGPGTNPVAHPRRGPRPRARDTSVQPKPHEPAGFLADGKVRNCLPRCKVGDSKYVAFRDAYQVVPDAEDHDILFAKDDISVGVTDRVAGRAGEGLNDGVVFRDRVVLGSIAPLAAVEPEKRAHREWCDARSSAARGFRALLPAERGHLGLCGIFGAGLRISYRAGSTSCVSSLPDAPPPALMRCPWQRNWRFHSQIEGSGRVW